MGRRKLTKLLLEAGAMQFQNLQHETPRDIAQRKNLSEILEILSTHIDTVDKKLQREAKKCKSPTKTPQGHAHHLLPHNSKLKHTNNDPNQKDSRNWSPYGCHYYPDTRNFPQPKLESLPKEPLAKGEQYYIDLGGNIRKGPVGTGNTCYCAPLFKEIINKNCKNVRKYADKANEKLDKRVAALAKQIEKAKHNKCLIDEDPDVDDYDEEEMGLEAINKIRDENKQMHLEKWLRRVYAGAANTNSDPPQSPQSSDINKTPEIMVSSKSHHKKTDKDRINSNEKHHLQQQQQHRISALVHQPSFSKMPIYDENGNHDRNQQQQQLYNDDGDEEDDDSYTDIDDDDEDDDDCSNSLSRKSCNSDGQQNALYDESFLRNFQHQQQHQQQFYQNSIQNDSLTSPSINSNQNIELEMDRITKSLMLINSSAPEKELLFRTPDVLTDHHHQQQHQVRKRSDLEIKSAVTKPTPTATISSSSILTSGDLYVNSYFNTIINNNNNNHNDIISSPPTPEMMREQQQTIVNASNICSNSSTQNYIQKLEVTHDMVSSLATRKEPMYDNLLGSGGNNQFWNGAGRVRNPLNIQEIEKYTENIFNNHPEESSSIPTIDHPVETTLNGNNFVLLDKLMKARKQLNHSYQQQLEMLNSQGQHQIHQPPTIPSHYTKANNDEINDYSVSASSLV